MADLSRFIGLILLGIGGFYLLRIYLGVEFYVTLTRKKVLLSSIYGSMIFVGIVLLVGAPTRHYDDAFWIGLLCFGPLMALFMMSSWLSGKFRTWLFTWLNVPSLIRLNVALTAITDVSGFPIGDSEHFDRTVPRIYCCVTPYTPLGGYSGTKLIAEWYYQERQINRQTYPIKSNRPINLWIEPSSDGYFQIGRYTVMLFVEQYNKSLVKKIEFIVS